MNVKPANASRRFIVYPGFELLDAVGPSSVFNSTNRVLAQQGRPAVYRVVFVSAEGGSVESSSGITVGTMAISGLKPGETNNMLIADC